MSNFEIVAREDFSDVTYLLEIRHPLMAKAAKPGQFVIVMEHEHGERIPLTLADFDPEQGTITLVIQAVGKTTREMQQNCQVGTRLYALVGPMGIPSHIGSAKKVVCVGGGLGVAPVYPQARAYKQRRLRDRRARLPQRKLDVLGGQVPRGLRRAHRLHRRRLGRDQGPRDRGHRAGDRAHADIDEVVAIGPPIMMKGCAEATRPHEHQDLVSLNPVMVDGTGMCGGCRVKVGDGIKFACVDGPDFDGHQVDFDDLMARLRASGRRRRRRSSSGRRAAAWAARRPSAGERY